MCILSLKLVQNDSQTEFELVFLPREDLLLSWITHYSLDLKSSEAFLLPYMSQNAQGEFQHCN